MLRSQ